MHEVCMLYVLYYPKHEFKKSTSIKTQLVQMKQGLSEFFVAECQHREAACD